MGLDTPVVAIMTPNPATVSPADRLTDVRRILFEQTVHHVPVVAGTAVVGMVSSTDLLRVGPLDPFASPIDIDSELEQWPVGRVMTKEVVTVSVHDPIRHAAELLAVGSFGALPVLDGEELVGIVTVGDVLRFVLDAEAVSARGTVPDGDAPAIP